MSELISRQELIEAIKKESELHSGGLYEDEMLDIIESQPPADQWIPCKTCDKRCDRWENSEI